MVKLSKLNGLKKIEDEAERREMITPALREALTKQGYKLIGSHSGVKLCRWTKSMLRGRGGCYKHTFYGIESHRCMETTPSLACANKCVFCWRYVPGEKSYCRLSGGSLTEMAWIILIVRLQIQV
ncbi:S-adenosyl-L-methionine-dependent tRNA 4-demethylwyosine synthase-like [Notothenia coriiceps]|uniref:S-adenosyl-L-methionine-dependent tRNA 4-demethylwyosine synthase-like n=1 Tax=Notothenia coriiceps TaxID=8208 RepID=A0A6I9P5J0_9TELE|nr:PREDICTED: S-adenosyl-L-methionine-dependent tRNA 4-demethylwyosine synthase-like [Notothenia coriiceps]